MIDFAEARAGSDVEPGRKPQSDPAEPEQAGAPEPEQPSAADRLDRLGDEIAELAAHLHALTYRLLERLRAFDACMQQAGGGMGFRSTAEWLSWRTGIGTGAAREKVRVARALGYLPLLSAALERGELSYSKARALTRVATPENEQDLLSVARSATAAQTERIVRAWKRYDRAQELTEERVRHERREFGLYPDSDGMYVVRGRLTPEVGAMLEQAMRAAEDALWRAEESEMEGSAENEHEREARDRPRNVSTERVGQRRADAIGLVAEWALGGSGSEGGSDVEPASSDAEAIAAEQSAAPRAPGRAGRFEVVVHVDADALHEGSEEGHAVLAGLRSDLHVSAETSRRIACDAGRVTMAHGKDGEILSVGRRRRTVPASIRRALETRDRGCRFPGCGSRYCDAHHVKHWADGGKTRLGNLVLLCRKHHRAVHEDGFRVEVLEGGERGERGECGEGDDGGEASRTADGTPGAHASATVRFRWPDGRPLPAAPKLPALATDPVAAIRFRHAANARHIDPWTPTVRLNCCDQGRMDRGWTMMVLLGREEGRREKCQ